MNWDAIGATAELLAGIGVIISFVYLARQIRENTKAQTRSNRWEVIKELKASMRHLSSDTELAAVVLRGFSDINSLNQVERSRFDLSVYDWLAGFEGAFLDARDGIYPDESLQVIKRAIAGYIRTDGGRAWWEQRRNWFTKAFQQAVDTILNDESIEVSGVGPIGV